MIRDAIFAVLQRGEKMDDMISRQAAIDATWQDTGYTDPFNVMTAIRDRIKQLPPIQSDIVRCKDCKHFESEYGYCDYYQWNMTGGDFCSKAEKREVNHESN